MKILLENVSENREEWLRLRSTTVGSSEIATIVGLNKWQTPLQLWMEKTGRAPAQEDNDAMRLGRLMESFIGEKFARDNPDKLSVCSANVLLAHDIHSRFTASPDFWLFKTVDIHDARAVNGDYKMQPNVVGVLECKNVNYRLADLWANGNCPDYAQIQLQWQLAITGLSGGYVAGLVGAQVNDFHFRPFDADSSIADQLFSAADKFLEFVKSDTPPAAVAADRQHIEKNMEPEPDSVIDLPDDAATLLQEYERALFARKQTEKFLKGHQSTEDAYRARLELLLGNASVGNCGEYSVNVKRINVKEHIRKASSYVNFTVKKQGKAL